VVWHVYTLQHTATYCNTLQHAATHCSQDKCVWCDICAHCNTLQHTATHCNTLQHNCDTLQSRQMCVAWHMCTLQHTATHCNTLQHTAVKIIVCGMTDTCAHCNTLQHTYTTFQMTRWCMISFMTRSYGLLINQLTYDSFIWLIDTQLHIRLVHMTSLIHSFAYTGWQRRIGSPKSQIIFHTRATKYRSLLQKMTYKDKGSYESSHPCNQFTYDLCIWLIDTQLI